MKEREQEKKLKELKSREVNKKQKPHGKLKPINGARYFSIINYIHRNHSFSDREHVRK